MTIKETNDPEIGFSPSAPLPPATAPPAPTNDVPIANAIPIVSATAVASTTSSSPSGANIERTTNADGSLFVKVTTTTNQSDGSKVVRIEEYSIPADLVGTVTESMDMTGDAPSSLYLVRMEEHRLPSEEVPSVEGVFEAENPAYGSPSLDAPPSSDTTPTPTQAPVEAEAEDEYEIRKKKIVRCIVIGIFVAAFFWIFNGSVNSTISQRESTTTVSSSSDDFFSPAFPSQPSNLPPPSPKINDDFFSPAFPSQPSDPSPPSPKTNDDFFSPAFPSASHPSPSGNKDYFGPSFPSQPHLGLSFPTVPFITPLPPKNPANLKSTSDDFFSPAFPTQSSDISPSSPKTDDDFFGPVFPPRPSYPHPSPSVDDDFFSPAFPSQPHLTVSFPAVPFFPPQSVRISHPTWDGVNLKMDVNNNGIGNNLKQTNVNNDDSLNSERVEQHSNQFPSILE